MANLSAHTHTQALRTALLLFLLAACPSPISHALCLPAHHFCINSRLAQSWTNFSAPCCNPLMEDSYQQSKTVSLPKRFSLSRKAGAGANRQRLLPASLTHRRAEGWSCGRALCSSWNASFFLLAFTYLCWLLLTIFTFKTTGKINQSQHNLQKHIAGLHVPPGRCLQRSCCNPGARSRSGPFVSPRTTLFLELRYQRAHIPAPNLCHRDRER